MIDNKTKDLSGLDIAPIHSDEIEKNVISMLMSSDRHVKDTLDILSPECFRNLKYREIYESVMRIYNRGDAPDMMLVSTDLSQNGSEITIVEIAEICTSSFYLTDIVPHARILQNYAYRRKLWCLGHELVTKSSLESESVEEIHSRVKEEIDSLFEDSQTVIETLTETYKNLQLRMVTNMTRREGDTYGTPTGFPAIDANGGLCESDLIVIGAESSKGKTSFATALAMSAIDHGDGVAFYSMEMQPVQLAARIASMKTGIPASKILYGRMTIEDINYIDRVMEETNTGKMYFDDRSTMSLSSILTSIRSLKAKYGIKGAVVDYLQLIDTKESGFSIEQARAECARRLKNIAKDLKIWVIAISQLNRSDYGNLPTMGRLRDSGQIAEAADNVLLIHRTKNGYPAPFDGIPSENTAMIIVGKGRNIGTGEFLSGFKPENTLFYPLSQEEVEELKKRGFSEEDQSIFPKDEDPF